MNHPDKNKPGSLEHYDLSEESSRRSDDKATQIARQVESDDVNEENSAGPVNPPESNNRVWTSSSED